MKILQSTESEQRKVEGQLRYQARKRQRVAAAMMNGTPLTPRERRIVALVAQGLSELEIGRRMSAGGMIKETLARICAKTGTRDMHDLAVWATVGRGRSLAEVAAVGART